MIPASNAINLGTIIDDKGICGSGYVYARCRHDLCCRHHGTIHGLHGKQRRILFDTADVHTCHIAIAIGFACGSADVSHSTSC
jgi:hypothetical protein